MINIQSKAWVCLLLIISMMLTSCATVNSAMGSMGQKEKIGTAGGVVGGAAIGGWLGNRLGGDAGMFAGILIGGAIGGYLGNKIGASFDDRDNRLAKIKAETGINIQRSTYPTLSKKGKSAFEASVKNMSAKEREHAYQSKVIYKTVVPSQFASGTSRLSPKMKSFFTDVAKAYKADGVRKVMIVGHADGQGNARMNQRLSENRAKAVAQMFRDAGYPSSGIYYQGAGESEPVADNATATGRAENRRVEIIDAGKTQDLAMAKRFSISESRSVMKKVHVKAPVKIAPLVSVAKNLSGTNSILPFHGELYNGQQLLESGHKAAVVEKPTGFFGGISTAINKTVGSLVGTAHASGEQVIPLFLNDDLAVSGSIKRLDGKLKNLFAPSDYLPGYYKQPIYTYLDGDAFFSLQPVSVLKEEALSGQMPSMIIYKRYDGKGDKADAKLRGAARLYVSGNNMLYRWKANDQGVKKSGVLGLDILLPTFKEPNFNKTHTEHLNAQVYYMERGKVMVDQVKLKLKLNKKSEIDWSI